MSEEKIARPVDEGYWNDESDSSPYGYNFRDGEPGKWERLYHGTTGANADLILQRGLKPFDHPDIGGRHTWGDEWLTPRPGHVYLTNDRDKAWRIAGDGLYGDKAVIEVDPAHLDPANINPDEDTGRHFEDNVPTGPTERWPSKGQWAEDFGYGDDPDDTALVLDGMGVHSIAHRGVIPPHAIKGVHYFTGLSDDGPQGWKTVPNPAYRPVTLARRQATIPTGTGYMYHVSPRKNREAILSQGLRGVDRDQIGTPWHTLRWGQPPGNYFFDNPDDAHDYIYNIHGRNHSIPEEDDYPDPDDEERYEWPDPPEGFHDWSDDEQDAWHDEVQPVERTDDPRGYDIWKVQTAGLPMIGDPETRLVDQRRDNRYWNLGDLHDAYEEHAEEHPQDRGDTPDLDYLHQDVGGFYGAEPVRYYVPQNIHPGRIELHQHVPAWGLNQEGLYDRMDNMYEREVPQPWMSMPFTELPMPGHESSWDEADPSEGLPWS